MKKRSTFKVLFYLKRDKQKANGTIPLFCRITVDGQEVRFSMKYDVNPRIWDVKTSKATGRTADAGQINSLVDSTTAAIYKIYHEIQEKENYVTAEKIKNVFLGIEQRQQTLLELFDSHNKERKLYLGKTINRSTYSMYCRTRMYLADFLQCKYNVNDISVKEINKQFIGNFETYLLSEYNFSKNYLTGLLKKLRHIIQIALDNEWIYKNPFNEYKLQWERIDRGYLTQSEIEKLINAKFEEKTKEVARDIFIFCCFTGLAYIDVKNLSQENIQSSFNGSQWIRGKRIKCNTDYSIPLMNIPKTIIEKYKGQTSGNFLLPVKCVQWYNILLERIGKQCGIDKKITSHLARHTFATLTLTKGVSIESVSKMLGHTKISTTQIYAKVTTEKLDRDISAFGERMESSFKNTGT